MTKENFQKYLEQIKNFNILVIGDLMLDKWEYYKSDRLSQEAPVPIVKPDKEEFVLGGAGNVAKNLSILGCNVSLLSLLGSDKYSSLIYNELLPKEKIYFDYITDSRINTLKRRLIVDNQHFLRIDDEILNPISEYLENELIKKFEQLITNYQYNAIILQDYNKGLLTNRIIQYFISSANLKKIKVYIDPKKNRYFRGAWLVKPNRKELLEISNSGSEISNINIFSWLKYNNIKNLLLTKSEEGMLLYSLKNKEEKIAEFKESFINNNPIDVTGAGDIVIALYTLLDLLNIDDYEKLYLTSLAAQSAIIKRGTSIINIDEINKILN